MKKVLSLFDGMSGGQIALNKHGVGYDTYYASEIDKHAIQVCQKNYPSTVQLGDINDWRNWDISFEEIDLVFAGSPCFVAGTKVVCLNSIKNIEDVEVGDEVLTHTGAYKTVLRVGNKKASVVKIVAQGATPTYTTGEHPYYVRTRYRRKNDGRGGSLWAFNDPEWVCVEDIRVGDYVGTPIINTNENPLNLTPDECFLIGLYIGDGHTRKDYRVSENRPNDRHWQMIITVGSHEKNAFEKAVNIKHSFYPHTQGVYRAVFSNKRLVEVVEEHCGMGAANKHFSKMLLDLPIPLLEKVLEGYQFADGSYRNNTYRVASVSKHLVESMALAIAKVYRTTCHVGFTKRKKTTVIEGRTVNQKDSHSIDYRRTHTKQSRAWVIDDVVWNPVKSVEHVNETQKVYNIEVDEDNSYIANNHIVHNCQGFSIQGSKLAFDDPQSKLFFTFMDILNHIKTLNPDVKFLLENVRMKQEYEDVITGMIGVNPITINSALVSAQNRVRNYWTNISDNIQQPSDKGLFIRDILDETVDDDDLIDKAESNPKFQYFHNVGIQDSLCKQVGLANINGYDSLKRVYSIDGKSPCLVAQSGGNTEAKIAINGSVWRPVTPLESERLQTVPEGYTEGVSTTQRRRMIGNGWNIDTIVHIFESGKLQ